MAILLVRKISVKISSQDPIEIPASFANSRTVDPRSLRTFLQIFATTSSFLDVATVFQSEGRLRLTILDTFNPSESHGTTRCLVTKSNRRCTRVVHRLRTRRNETNRLDVQPRAILSLGYLFIYFFEMTRNFPSFFFIDGHGFSVVSRRMLSAKRRGPPRGTIRGDHGQVRRSKSPRTTGGRRLRRLCSRQFARQRQRIIAPGQ